MQRTLRRSLATLQAPTAPPQKSSQYTPPTPKELATAEREIWIAKNTYLESDPGTKGPHFLGGKRHPFPHNPLFIPVNPLSSVTRASIAQMYGEGSAFVDIATSFGISVARVHAVVKLANIAREWENNGIALQTDLQTNMDRLLGAQTRTRSSREVPMEKPKPLASQRLKPLFHFIATDAASLTPQEAAEMLDKTPFVSENTYTKKQAPLTPTVISSDTQETSKYTFLFTDPVSNEMTVRQDDGVLRTASRQELYWRDNRRAKYRHCE